MNVLAVRPEYQRKGLGSMLLEPVLKQADAEGRRTYIEASKMGLGLYLRLGWKEFDELLLDLRPCGGTTVEKTSLMIREPQSGK
jgi:GNAT superfamily N-acetyltransferase